MNASAHLKLFRGNRSSISRNGDLGSNEFNIVENSCVLLWAFQMMHTILCAQTIKFNLKIVCFYVYACGFIGWIWECVCVCLFIWNVGRLVGYFSFQFVRKTYNSVHFVVSFIYFMDLWFVFVSSWVYNMMRIPKTLEKKIEGFCFSSLLEDRFSVLNKTIIKCKESTNRFWALFCKVNRNIARF